MITSIIPTEFYKIKVKIKFGHKFFNLITISLKIYRRDTFYFLYKLCVQVCGTFIDAHGDFVYNFIILFIV